MVERLQTKDPIPYAITSEQFINGFDQQKGMEPYIFGQIVTRQNFTPFLSENLARSRGTQPGLWAQWDWLRIHTGFDHQSTMSAFLQEGGYDILDEQEQTYILEKAKSVSSERHSILTKENMSTQLVFALNFVTKPDKQTLYREFFPEELLADMDAKEFKSYLTTALKDLK